MLDLHFMMKNAYLSRSEHFARLTKKLPNSLSAKSVILHREITAKLFSDLPMSLQLLKECSKNFVLLNELLPFRSGCVKLRNTHHNFDHQINI
jgi:hypothetical protein